MSRSLELSLNLPIPYVPYGRQDISDDDVAAVVEALRSDFLTQGPAVPRFEGALSTYCGAKHAVALNSATSALHVACLALGVGPGDLVWTSPITFVASSNCALYCGASVDFVDIDPHTYNLSAERLREKLEQAAKDKKLPKVVIPVHLCGQSCEMDKIHALGKEYGFRIIEDASHAVGGKYKGEPVGNCRYSDITIFSFHPVKIITTAEGGMAVTNDPLLAKRMRLMGSHGITRNLEDMSHEPDGNWYYEQVELGYNYRMTDIQAALGLSQLNRLDSFVSQRHEIADRYDVLLDKLPVTCPSRHPDAYSALHLYVIQLRLDEIKVSHREAFEMMHAEGVGVAMHYIPVYSQPYYRKLGFGNGYCPAAEKYYSAAMTLPIFPLLGEKREKLVVDILAKVLGN